MKDLFDLAVRGLRLLSPAPLQASPCVGGWCGVVPPQAPAWSVSLPRLLGGHGLSLVLGSSVCLCCNCSFSATAIDNGHIHIQSGHVNTSTQLETRLCSAFCGNSWSASDLIGLEGSVDNARAQRRVRKVGAALPSGRDQDSMEEAGGAMGSIHH